MAKKVELEFRQLTASEWSPLTLVVGFGGFGTWIAAQGIEALNSKASGTYQWQGNVTSINDGASALITLEALNPAQPPLAGSTKTYSANLLELDDLEGEYRITAVSE